MRIAIDMQGVQSHGNRNRGIGRYSNSLVKAMLKQTNRHEVFLVLNATFESTIDPIRAEYADLLPITHIRVWGTGRHSGTSAANDDENRKVLELLRESFVAALRPDIVIITSLFESYDAVTSISQFTTTLPTVVVHYDLIPLIHKHIYLADPINKRWYLNKLDHLRRANMLLSISESSCQEAVNNLGFSDSQVFNISSGCDTHFCSRIKVTKNEAIFCGQHGLLRPYVMYTGSSDHRKNIDGLIRAFAALPADVRRAHQLAVVCSLPEVDKHRFMLEASRSGLAEGEVILTGFVSEYDLVELYHGCKLFVFPSWHEGFGLPALEAMACGCAVIGANTSSLPEVIGREDALFDPHDDSAITAKMLQCLTDDDFRADLAEHGLMQASKFTWTISAKRAWTALESLKKQATPTLPATMHRPRLAYVSPVPGAKSGIADYSAQLLPELSRHYHIDIIASQEEPVSDAWILANCTVRDVAWFKRNASNFDRVLYHFGNSPFHGHMFDLLSDIPGVIVLHDFFLSGVLNYLHITSQAPGAWASSLLAGHGWSAAASSFNEQYLSETLWTLPCNLDVIQQALGVIVHSEHSKRLAAKWLPESELLDWSLIPLVRERVQAMNRVATRKELGIAPDDFVVCSFGLLGPTNLNHRLIKSWQASSLATEHNCRLVFVGQNEVGEYGADLARLIRGAPGRIEITGWVSNDDLRRWLAVADVGVQLQTQSSSESLANVLDYLSFGIATIVNATGPMTGFLDDALVKLEEDFTDFELLTALTNLWKNKKTRLKYEELGGAPIEREHRLRRCADSYFEAIERNYAKATTGSIGLAQRLCNLGISEGVPAQIFLAQTLAGDFPPFPRRCKLLLDVSELVCRDARTGIQRVVRSLLLDLLNSKTDYWLVEPVYASISQPGYRYARKFTCSLLSIPSNWVEDELVEAWDGDTFLALDLNHSVLLAQAETLGAWRQKGVKVKALVYDLLPVLQPAFFPDGLADIHHRWLEAVARLDGAIVISRSVADELHGWLTAYGSSGKRLPFQIHAFHLGSDVENSAPSSGLPADAISMIERIQRQPTFLMVGTLEPRKGHAFALDALEYFWQMEGEAFLVIVGKKGWHIDAFVERLLNHREFGKRLFWLENISDEYLQRIYKSSTCLIAASTGEGFGLPLVEAAKHELPIIARDIPVFREVAGEHAAYFGKNATAKDLSRAITDWLDDHARGQHPSSSGMPLLTWRESAQQLVAALSGSAPYKIWVSDGAKRYWGNDKRLSSQVGLREGQAILTSGRAGFLLYGPYQELPKQSYTVRIAGTARNLGGDEFFEIVFDKGNGILLHETLNNLPYGKWDLTFDIHVAQKLNDFEIRVWVQEETDLTVTAIEFLTLVTAHSTQSNNIPIVLDHKNLKHVESDLAILEKSDKDIVLDIDANVITQHAAEALMHT